MNVTGSNLMGGTVQYGAAFGEKIRDNMQNNCIFKGAMAISEKNEDSNAGKIAGGLLLGAGALALGVVAHKTGIFSKITSTFKNAEGKNIFEKLKSTFTGENVKKGVNVLKDGAKTLTKDIKTHAKEIQEKFKSSAFGERLDILKGKGKDFGKELIYAGKTGLNTTKNIAKETIQKAKDYIG